MDDIDLDHLETLEAATTPGPWRALVEGRDFVSGDSFIRTADEGDGADLYVTGGPNTLADLEFIAAARTAMPALREVRRLGLAAGGNE